MREVNLLILWLNLVMRLGFLRTCIKILFNILERVQIYLTFTFFTWDFGKFRISITKFEKEYIIISR